MSEVSAAKAKENYKIYPGEYPVIVIENLGYTRRSELNLNKIVEQHNLGADVDKIVWVEHILAHRGLFDVLITAPETWRLLSVYSFPTEGLRANGEYIVPEKVVKALINRCENDYQPNNNTDI